MPTLFNEAGEKLWVPDEEVLSYIKQGWSAEEGTRLNVRQGLNTGTVAVDDALDAGVTEGEVRSQDEVWSEEQQRMDEELFDTLGQEALTGLEGFARGLTFGGSDYLLEKAGVDPEMMAGRRDVNSTIGMGSEIAGAIAPAFATGGGSAGVSAGRVGGLLARTPAGLAIRAGSRVAAQGAGKGLASRVGYAAAGGGLEGALFGGGQAVSDMVLRDKELTAESFVASVGSHALFGGAIGGAIPIAAAAGSAIRRSSDKLATAIATKVGKKADDVLLSSPVRPKQVTALQKSGDDLAAAADDALGSVRRSELAGKATLSSGQRVAIEAQREALASASSALGAARRAGGDDLVEAVTNYHKAADELHTGLNTLGFKTPGPPPVIAQTADELDVRLADVVENEVAEEGMKSARKDLGRAAVEIDSAGERAIAEAGPILATRDVAAEAMGGTLDDILAEAGAVDTLKKKVSRAESARDKFRALWKVASGKADDQTIGALMSSSSDDFVKAVKAYDSYDVAVRSLNDHLDSIAPASGAPSRNAALPESGGLLRPNRPVPKTDKWDVGDYLAVADLAGVNLDTLPIIGDIPGIGWLLQARMAARRLKGVRAKLSGDGAKVGAIAAKANAYQARVRSAAQKFLAHGKTAAKAKTPASLAILNSIAFGDEGEGTDALDAFDKRQRELAAAVANPSATKDRLRGQVPKGAGELGDLIVNTEWMKIQHLYKTMPKDPRSQSPVPAPWMPDAAEMDEWVERAWIAESPASAFDMLNAGTLTPAGADTLRTVYPSTFADFSEAMLSEAAGLDELDHDRAVQAGVLFGLPLIHSETPEYITAMQATYAEVEKRQKPGMRGGAAPPLSAPAPTTFNRLLK